MIIKDKVGGAKLGVELGAKNLKGLFSLSIPLSIRKRAWNVETIEDVEEMATKSTT